MKFTIQMRKITPKALRKLGFKAYADDGCDPFYPSIGWHGPGGFIILEAIENNSGYWMVISSRASGEETGRVNFGQYTTVRELKRLLNGLKFQQR